MRILVTALTAVALAVLLGHAAASTPSAALEDAKPETDAGQLMEGHAASAPSGEPALANTTKPTEQTAAQSGVSAEPKPDQPARTNASERDPSPTES
jgi:hypothetical protein